MTSTNNGESDKEAGSLLEYHRELDNQDGRFFRGEISFDEMEAVQRMLCSQALKTESTAEIERIKRHSAESRIFMAAIDNAEPIPRCQLLYSNLQSIGFEYGLQEWVYGMILLRYLVACRQFLVAKRFGESLTSVLSRLDGSFENEWEVLRSVLRECEET